MSRLSQEDLAWLQSLILSILYNLTFHEAKDRDGEDFIISAAKRFLNEKVPRINLDPFVIHTLVQLEARLVTIDIQNVTEVEFRALKIHVNSEPPLPPLFEPVPSSDADNEDNECSICHLIYGEPDQNGCVE